jgi:hypothetical protein
MLLRLFLFIALQLDAEWLNEDGRLRIKFSDQGLVVPLLITCMLVQDQYLSTLLE